MKKASILLLLAPASIFAHNVSDNIDIMPLKSMDFPMELKKEMHSYNVDMKSKGYVEKDNPYVRQLMHMRFNRPTFKESDAPGSSELKQTPQEIKTTFSFKSILPHPIAYAGIGIASDKGWSGIKEFFDGKEAGMCTLSMFSMADVKQHIQLNEDGLTYDINDKPTRVMVEGHQNSGFMYSVRWYDKSFVREIECANNKLDDAIKTKMIEYATLVDKA